MTDLKDAIDRVGARFDPQAEGFDDLIRRRTRARVRRRLTAGGLALAMAAGGLVLAVRAFRDSTPGPSSALRVIATWTPTAGATPMAAPSAGTTCPTPSGDSPGPVLLSSTSGTAESWVAVSGTFWNEELWVQLWWNAGEIGDHVDGPPWPPTGPDLPFAPAGQGPVVRLASVAGPAETGDCTFRTSFTVPQVEPGTYQLQWVFGKDTSGPRKDGGFALMSSAVTFEVTG